MDRSILLKINQEWSHPALDRIMVAFSSFPVWTPLRDPYCRPHLERHLPRPSVSGGVRDHHCNQRRSRRPHLEVFRQPPAPAPDGTRHGHPVDSSERHRADRDFQTHPSSQLKTINIWLDRWSLVSVGSHHEYVCHGNCHLPLLGPLVVAAVSSGIARGLFAGLYGLALAQ